MLTTLGLYEKEVFKSDAISSIAAYRKKKNCWNVCAYTEQDPKWGNSSPSQMLRQEGLCEFETSLGYVGRLSQREGVYVCEILLFRDGTFNENKFSTFYQ